MSPKIVDKQEKRLQIAHAAAEVFGMKGFERTRIDDVASAAGVGKGTIYEYFTNKEELLQGTFDLLMRGMMEESLLEIDDEKSAVSLIKKMTRDTIWALANMGYVYRFFLEYMLHSSRSGSGLDQIAKLLNEYRQWLARLIEKGKRDGEFRQDIDSFETAAAYVAWFDGVVFHWFVLPHSVSLETMGERFLQMTLNGLAPLADAEKKGEDS
jgi:AcrR family transcriptional regulator